ncbi:hypothetical protein C6569_01015 [Phreatobacter cathodiphilus]|uniref:Uncharacterized protein n=1 Tax=Phreatobacter cathodiphilus TaxID=1868589 RepID=A0A2S0N6X8_9HYPH|nr:hypothetical protein C6569_01015 [Phreatobacter cathodiphilus]
MPGARGGDEAGDDGGIVHRVEAAEMADAGAPLRRQPVELGRDAAERAALLVAGDEECGLAMGEEGGDAPVEQQGALEIQRRLKSGQARIELSRDADEASKIAP